MMTRVFFLFCCCFVAFSSNAFAVDSLTSSQRVLAEGMQVQAERLKIISENIANANSTGDGRNSQPYRRKAPLLSNKHNPIINSDVVRVERIVRDKLPFNKKYEPHHPAADASGYVNYPNINIALESIDAKEAQRTFEANLTALEISKSNQMRLIEAMK